MTEIDAPPRLFLPGASVLCLSLSVSADTWKVPKGGKMGSLAKSQPSAQRGGSKKGDGCPPTTMSL
jgi:hypothetical protein